MRNIVFRGRKTHSHEWVEGSLITADNFTAILEAEDKVHPMDYPYLDGDLGTIDGKATPVEPETVGQFTGWEFNGVKAFEGDIVKSGFGVGVIQFGEYTVDLDLGDIEIDDHAETWVNSIGFYIEYTDGTQTLPDCDWMHYFTIIGNIYDNPEMYSEKMAREVIHEYRRM